MADLGGSPLGDVLQGFAGGDPVERPCSGGCGRKIMTPRAAGWCADCLAASEAEAARKRERIDLRLALESIPAAFRDCRAGGAWMLDRLRDGAATWARIIRQRPWPNGATIVGAAGTGKTSLACAMLDAWLHCETLDVLTRGRGRFAAARTLPVHAMQRFDNLELATLYRAPMLVVDDVGAELDTPVGRAAVGDLLAERHAWDRPTIVTTWLDDAGVRARYGDGIARRLFERTAVVQLSNPAAATGIHGAR